jgi:hypothetical protein
MESLNAHGLIEQDLAGTHRRNLKRTRSMHVLLVKHRLLVVCVLVGMLVTAAYRDGYASDHLDTPTVIADPAADIGDIYAWTSSDGRRLNLVMDIVAHQFSDQLEYVFHVDSGERFGKTTATTLILCRFDTAQTAECWVGNADYARGNASNPAGIEGENHRFRIFAGLRDDPFFNNVKGTREAYDVAGAALQNGMRADAAGCSQFDQATSQKILNTWRHTSGGPALNFLAGWQASSLVLSIDLDLVAKGGKLLAVWGAVHRAPRTQPLTNSKIPGKGPAIPTLGNPIERTARPLIKNALVGGPVDPDALRYRRREAYNRAQRIGWTQFAGDIERNLGLYDGFDGKCGNQWLADMKADPRLRYRKLATLLADDRVWINSASATCTQFLAVEFAALTTPGALAGDCGGRTPNYDASNIFRSLLIDGTSTGGIDGLTRDEKTHSTIDFPFLAAP